MTKEEAQKRVLMMTTEQLADYDLFRKRVAADPNPSPSDVAIVDLLAHIDALTAEIARLRGTLDALVTMHDAREERGWDTQSVADFAEALRAARGGE